MASEVFLFIDGVATTLVELWKKTFKVLIGHIANSDEVAMTFHFLHGRTIHHSHVGTLIIRVRYRLTVVLTV